MNVELVGTIEKIKLAEVFGTTTKVEIIVKTEGEYPQSIPVSFFNEKVNYLDSFAPGDQVIVNTNMRGSEYLEKNYVSLTAWRITKKALS